MDNGAAHVITCSQGFRFLVVFLTDTILRIRCIFPSPGDTKHEPSSLPVEESYILTLTAWEDRLDKVLGSERTRIKKTVRPRLDMDKGLLIA